MTDPGFKVESIQHAAPFRVRASFGGYEAFGDRNGMVLVEPGTAQALRTAAHRALPQETGGLLSGRALRDGDGQYVLVSGFVQAGPSAGRSAAFEMSPQETERLKVESYLAYPTADMVGWWHSHSVPSSYSTTDLNTQTIFTKPESVGLLVFATGQPWATVYLGPKATKLGYLTRVRGPEPARPDDNGRPAAGARHGQGQPVPTSSNAVTRKIWHPESRSPGQARLTAIMASVLVLILLLAIVLVINLLGVSSRLGSNQQQLSGQINSGERQLSGQINSAQGQITQQIKEAITTPSPPPFVDFSCVPSVASDDTYSGFFNCTATPSVSSGEVKWYLNSHPYPGGNPVAIQVPFKRHARYQIQAVLVTPDGKSYPAPPQVFSF
jgi:hypothetical protein